MTRILAMPPLPVSMPDRAQAIADLARDPLYMPANPLGPSAPGGADQAKQGVTMLKDPKLSSWPSFFSGKRYEDVDQLPMTGTRADGRLDDEIWVPHVRQGALGDCWFMGTLASMALAGDAKYHPGIRRIDDEHVALKFGDRQFGIGDDLPYNRKDKLLYARQNKPHFEATWPVYYEKAAASLRGGYKALDGGWPSEAFELLLGEAPKEISTPSNMFGYMRRALDAGLPVAVTTRSDQSDLMTDVKLHANHTYAVRKFVELASNGAPAVEGVKLWNPWGSEHPKVITMEQFEALCDTVTTPKESFGWGARTVVPV